MTWFVYAMACDGAPPGVERELEPTAPAADRYEGKFQDPPRPPPEPEREPVPLAISQSEVPPELDGAGIVLGAGRIAILDPGFVPASVTTSHAASVDVESSPPYLMVLGLDKGQATVTVERQGGGSASWEVFVMKANHAPTGGPGLQPPGEVLQMPVGEGAVCSFPGATAFVQVENKKMQILEFGPGKWFVTLDGPTHGDLVFQQGRRGPPKVLSVAASLGDPPPPDVIPPSCLRPTDTVPIPLAGTVEIDFGKKVGQLLVGAPGVVHVGTMAGPTKLELTGVKAGTTTLAVKLAGSDAPALRTLVVSDSD